MKFNVRADLNQLPTYESNTHYAEIIVDANESPANLPTVVLEKINKLIMDYPFNRYPQINAYDLRVRIANKYSLTPENVQVSNGSSSLLSAFCQMFAGRKIMYPEPSFSMYQVYIKLAQAQGIPYLLEEDFSLDTQSLIEQINREQPDMVILCNPNNPTGNFTRIEAIRQVLESTNCLILLDEAYIEFNDESCIRYLDKFPNLVILRTFSKAYALASLRLGYALADTELINMLGRLLLPYQVNGLTLLIGECVVENLDAYQPQIEQVINARQAISAKLSAMGFAVVPSTTNFVFFYHENKELMQDLAVFLAENLIAVRDYTAKDILKNGIRLTVGTDEENSEILSVIKEFIKER